MDDEKLLRSILESPWRRKGRNVRQLDVPIRTIGTLGGIVILEMPPIIYEPDGEEDADKARE